MAGNSLEALRQDQADLMTIFQEARAFIDGGSPNAPERTLEIQQLASYAAAEFVGRTVTVSTVDRDDDPITTWVFETPYPAFGTAGFRKHTGLFRTNPRKIAGTVEQIDLGQATLKVKPRKLSPLRLDRGFFLIDALSPDRQPRVKVVFDAKEL